MERLSWLAEKEDWPLHQHSRFVTLGELQWHVQELGDATRPCLVLIHGTGASTHSWSWVMPILAEHYRVFAMDLPGHGFSSPIDGPSFTLPNIARLVGALLQMEGIRPFRVIGHSAGGAIAIRMVLDNQLDDRAHLITLNGALLPFPGAAGFMMPTLAKLLFLNPFAARFLSWRAQDKATVRRLLEGTGSLLSERQFALYEKLFATRQHVDGALNMMGYWNLNTLSDDMPNLRAPVDLIAASNDEMVPPNISERAHEMLPNSHLHYLRGLGHLAHEEAPQAVGDLITSLIAQQQSEAAQAETSGP